MVDGHGGVVDPGEVHHRPFRECRVEDRVWTDEDSRRYRENECDTVVVSLSGRSRVTLDFVRELPGLRCVYVEGPVKDDTPVFDVAGLESLTLLTRSKKPLSLDRLPLLRELAVHDRPGIEGIRELRSLRELTVVRWEGKDLAFLGDKPELRFLRLEGRKNRAWLDGVEGAPELDELMVLDVCVESIESLRGLRKLREVQLTGVDGLTAAQPWDLSVIEGMERLEWFRAPFNGPVRSLAPVRTLPSLRGVSIGLGAEILDGDLSVFAELPSDVIVGPFDNRKHYSHTEKEIERLRSTGG